MVGRGNDGVTELSGVVGVGERTCEERGSCQQLALRGRDFGAVLAEPRYTGCVSVSVGGSEEGCLRRRERKEEKVEGVIVKYRSTTNNRTEYLRRSIKSLYTVSERRCGDPEAMELITIYEM